MNRIVVWYSCGVTSAVAAKMVLDRYRDCGFPIVVAYCDTASEHPDNERFLKDCEEWFDYPITILHSKDYDDIWVSIESLCGIIAVRIIT